MVSFLETLLIEQRDGGEGEAVAGEDPQAVVGQEAQQEPYRQVAHYRGDGDADREDQGLPRVRPARRLALRRNSWKVRSRKSALSVGHPAGKVRPLGARHRPPPREAAGLSAYRGLSLLAPE